MEFFTPFEWYKDYQYKIMYNWRKMRNWVYLFASACWKMEGFGNSSADKK
jgi:hypothetical protein